MTNHKQQSMNHDDKRGMMGSRMHLKIQNRITAEWYNQMMGMHRLMEQMHRKDMIHSSLAKKHEHVAEHYKKTLEMLPISNDENTQLKNKEGDPKLLNGANIYAQNCASCHGQNGQGIGKAFPPLVNSNWITGDKSVPVRIIRNGLQGPANVNGQRYEGEMPAFKARLSIAEIAAVVNYLREKSDGSYPDITQDDIIKISNTYRERNKPWHSKELSGE